MTLVIFSLKNVRYAVDVSRVEEVIPLPAITPLYNLPSSVCGIIDLRGNAVPIIDLRKRLGHGDHPYELDNDIIVIKVNGKIAGLIVDKVLSVIDIQEKQMIAPPDVIDGLDNRYIASVAQMESELVLLLNLDNILTAPERDILNKMEIDPHKVS